MTPEVVAISVRATAAAHHWQARLRLVLHVGPDKLFILLSYDDGSSVVYEAIDESGTVGGDWWGQARASSLEDCLHEFAQTNGLPIDSLWAAISAVQPTERSALRGDESSDFDPLNTVASSGEARDGGKAVSLRFQEVRDDAPGRCIAIRTTRPPHHVR